MTDMAFDAVSCDAGLLDISIPPSDPCGIERRAARKAVGDA